MDAERWLRIQTVFHAAAALAASDRTAFVESTCGSDRELIGEVLAMLEEDSRAASLLDRGLAAAAQSLTSAAAPAPAQLPQFGPYRVRGLIGQGGMGVVYLAERSDLGSLVAIKVLRDAWLSPARHERFLGEQRTLAQLNHPAIARLYDADSLPDGTPWFAMEYVDGRPLTEYCRQRGANVEERLRLLRMVAEAVEYAHRQAIIHRDLKPSNILVRADGAVKLLDFGIAKQLDPADQGQAPTITGLRLMTPAYAAPEQIRGERAGVYSDVYSLGVILYELLAGRLPFDPSACTPAQAESLILESTPEKPSVAHALPASRNSWADLDVLCLTAMHKDVARRYRSVEAFVRDIEHYLDGEPLEARPDSVRYTLGKFVRRRRRAVTAAAAAFVVAASLIVFFTLRLAAARNVALAQASRARRIQQFMLNLFDRGDHSAGPPDNLRAAAVVDRGVREARALDREPAVQADLYATLGGIYQKLGNLEKADTLLTLALGRRRAIFGSEHREVAESLVALGLLRMDQARLEDAEKLVRDGLAMSGRTLPADDPALARAQTALGRIEEQRGDYQAAIATLEAAVRLESAAPDSAADLAAALSELANTQFYQGNYAISEQLNRRVLAMHEQAYGERHPLVADDLLNLAAIQTNLGHFAEAEAFDQRALEINRSWYGNDHPETGASLNYLGQALVLEGRFDEAQDMLQQALDIQERVYGPVHQRVAVALNELGLLAMRRGKFDEAVARFRRAVDIDRVVYGGRHQSVALESANLASAYLEKKEYTRAEQLFGEVIALYRQLLPPGHLNIGIAEIKLGRTLMRERRYAESESHMLAGYAIISTQTSPAVKWQQTSRDDLVALYVASGQPEKAARFRK
ncbi:MAG TPA: serine/threonine-protein kinase [Bryobacteraceae bacterium]|nr:serine/threonine-protein kinase [Bryobacteraceae bacterium]